MATMRLTTSRFTTSVLLLISLSGAFSSEEYNVNVDGTVSVTESSSTDDDSCGLYLAESAIPNSGLGMFTAKSIAHNERIFYGEIVCNIEDFEENMRLRRQFLSRSNKNTPSWLLDSYYWSPSNALAEFEAEEVSSVIPGLGMLANSHPGLVNAIQRPPQRVADLHRTQHPGAGASTHFHDVHFVADGDIEAGAELFVEYGDTWFRDRRKYLGDIPLSRHWKHANAVLQKYSEIMDSDYQSKIGREMYELLQFAVKLEPRMKNALPEDVSDVPKALEEGAAKTLLPGRVKTKEWLEENGMCLDHIRPGLSTIAGAGRGAFATRRLAKGSVIAPLPVVQLRRYQMEVYELRAVAKADSDDDEEEDQVFRIGSQLLLNYCFGHPQSSLLLYPYSPVVNYLNHNQTLKNAELRWSNHANHRKDWLDRSPADLDVEKYAGLIMEIVATRDIEAGEEVFLDYGDDWEKAWQTYVAEWQPPAEPYISAADRNARNEPLLLDSEMEKDPSYENVLMGCFVELPFDDAGEDGSTTTITWAPATEEVFDVNDLHECFVVKKHNNDLYDVVIKEERQTWRVMNIRREAIQYFDVMYTSDMFLRSAFRHEMALPDSMVPDAWRDIFIRK
ncbi:hypothetical protein FisN_29Hh134 [Fistulifera solaris]|uniref:SET domain-containing protein n=1 Tax=Fistulifera solaris TaxID=1519565 RepID=A0A1Z5K5X5_FISSO|nr:hypothetical protein FisN_29Hh134 [Fistulifera solaris]|eukprot:GAX21693.1 hypothetical protein FisN_29Hh134 [Fistulifera solaris]